MRDLILLFVHVFTTLIRLGRPGGVRSVLAESILLRHQLLILNRSRHRGPNLRTGPAYHRIVGDICAAETIGTIRNRGETIVADVVADPDSNGGETCRASNNAVKIFLNGREIFFREEYHHGTRMDQHVGKGKLKAGRNGILIKVCQDNQTPDWAQTWGFQLRVCDALGGAVPMKLAAAKSSAVEGGGR